MKTTKFYMKYEYTVTLKNGDKETIGTTTENTLDPTDDFEECRELALKSAREFVFYHIPQIKGSEEIEYSKEEPIKEVVKETKKETKKESKNVFADLLGN